MKININNTEIVFNNIIKNKDLIYINSDFKLNSILTTYKINFDKFIDLLETSLDCYVDLTDKDIICFRVKYYLCFETEHIYSVYWACGMSLRKVDVHFIIPKLLRFRITSI